MEAAEFPDDDFKVAFFAVNSWANPVSNTREKVDIYGIIADVSRDGPCVRILEHGPTLLQIRKKDKVHETKFFILQLTSFSLSLMLVPWLLLGPPSCVPVLCYLYGLEDG